MPITVKPTANAAAYANERPGAGEPAAGEAKPLVFCEEGTVSVSGPAITERQIRDLGSLPSHWNVA